jgi:hypothetical protein
LTASRTHRGGGNPSVLVWVPTAGEPERARVRTSTSDVAKAVTTVERRAEWSVPRDAPAADTATAQRSDEATPCLTRLTLSGGVTAGRRTGALWQRQ